MTENISRMKLVHQLIPTRALLCPRKQESTSKCLRCNLVSKTHDYVIRCQWSQKIKAHKDSLSSLQCKLRKHNNSPLIIHAVTALITENHHTTPATCPEHPFYKRQNKRVLDEVIQRKQSLRPNSLMRGLYSRNSMLLQNLHEKIPIDHINLQWSQHFLRSLWTYSQSIWLACCKNVKNFSTDNPHSITHT